jgi:hypothetical protein
MRLHQRLQLGSYADGEKRFAQKYTKAPPSGGALYQRRTNEGHCMERKCSQTFRRKYFVRTVHALFCVLLTLPSVRAEAQRSLPDDNLGYPVLVTLADGSSGSGFFLNAGPAVYLITARHVLFNPKSPTSSAEDQKDPWALTSNQAVIRSYSRDPADLDPNVMTIDLSLLVKEGLIKHGTDKNKDVAVVHIADVASVGQPALPVKGVQMVHIAKQGILGVALDTIKKFDDTLVGNDILVFGYPSSLGLRNSPQIDYERPLLRKGIIAGKNLAARSLIIDCAVYPGNSGGPVVEIDHVGFQTHFTVVVVVVEYIPFAQVTGSNTIALQVLSNSGYSVVLPMDDVIELLK